MTFSTTERTTYTRLPPGVTDLLAGRVSLMFTSIISARHLIDSGKLRVLATAGAKRAACNDADRSLEGESSPPFARRSGHAMRAGEAILKPVYRHKDGTFGAPVYVKPTRFTVIEGLLGYYTADMRDIYDVRVFLAPPEDLRRKWKVDRDCSRRGYTTDQVLAELDRREPDSAAYIRPQERYADLVVSFMLGDTGDAHHPDAELVLREGLPHPDLSPFIGNGRRGITLRERGDDRHMRIPGDIDRERAAELEEAIWDRLHFATHLRSQRLGEFTVGTELHRSESLALVQLLILYHVVTARAAIALGGTGTRAGGSELPVAAAPTPNA